MPNSKGLKLERIEKNERVTQISKPGIYSFFPSKEENTHSAVLILPSGGYHHMTYVLGGTQLAKWFNTLGINAFLLLYRLPTSPDLLERSVGLLQDAQRAMRFIRANSVKWNIDPKKIGVMGASSGGHLASTLGTHTVDVSAIKDSLDQYSFMPKFMILISLVISMGKYTHQGSLYNLLGKNPSPELINQYSNELHVDENTCPAFIVHAANDIGVNPINSILFYQSFLKYNIPASLHIFPQGGHRIGIVGNPGSTDLWMELCRQWLLEKGIVNSN
jgi:acetyl esterase/lipase